MLSLPLLSRVRFWVANLISSTISIGSLNKHQLVEMLLAAYSYYQLWSTSKHVQKCSTCQKNVARREVKILWSGIRVKYINFQNNITIYKTLLIFRTDILTFSKHILAYTNYILILRTYILKFFEHILPFTKHILILRTDNTCFFKQVLIFPYRYYLRYKCCRTCQQELSCIKQSGQSCETYHIQNSTR